MKIAIRFSPPTDYRGGSQYTYASNLIGALYNLHKEIVLFTSSRQVFESIEGLSLHTISQASNKLDPKWIVSWFYHQLTIGRSLTREKCDVLFCPSQFESVLFPIIPQVIIVNDLIPLIYPEYFKTSILYRFPFKIAAKNAKVIVAISENTKKDIMRLYNIPAEKVFVVHIGYAKTDNILENNTQNPYGEYILNVPSNHYPHKNLLGLIEAYHRISLFSSHKLIIVGKTSPRFSNQIVAKIAQLGLSKRIMMLNNLTDEELAKIYQNADLFVYPSLYEGFGMPPLEAMSYGVPVIASSAASIPEACGDAAYYINPYCTDSLVDAIIKVLTDGKLRQELVGKGLERIKLFSWRKTAEGILHACQAAVDL